MWSLCRGLRRVQKKVIYVDSQLEYERFGGGGVIRPDI